MISVYDFNRFGRSHKTVGIEEAVSKALSDGANTLPVISSGNYVKVLIDEVKRRKLQGRVEVVNLTNHHLGYPCTEIHIDDGLILRDENEREAYVRERLSKAGFVRDLTDFMPKAYRQRAEDILSTNPDYVAVGIGSGKLFVAIGRTIKEKGLETKLVGVMPRGENGVFNEDNLYTDEEGRLRFKVFEPKSKADKLITPYTSFKPEILELQKQGHLLLEASDEELVRANQTASEGGYRAEVSGSAGFLVCNDNLRTRLGISDDSNIVVINTGRGHNRERISKRKRWVKAAVAFTSSLGLAAGLLFHDYDSELRERVTAEYDGGIVRVANDLGMNVESVGDLSHNQLRYLSARRSFENVENPEIFEAYTMAYVNATKDGKKTNKPIWDLLG